MIPKIAIDQDLISDFCCRWKVAELSLFGSVLRDDFDPERSDVDVLIEFQPNHGFDLVDLVEMGEQLGDLFGRRVDLVTKPALKPRLRQSILDSAQVVYAAA